MCATKQFRFRPEVVEAIWPDRRNAVGIVGCALGTEASEQLLLYGAVAGDAAGRFRAHSPAELEACSAPCGPALAG